MIINVEESDLTGRVNVTQIIKIIQNKTKSSSFKGIVRKAHSKSQKKAW